MSCLLGDRRTISVHRRRTRRCLAVPITQFSSYWPRGQTDVRPPWMLPSERRCLVFGRYRLRSTVRKCRGARCFIALSIFCAFDHSLTESFDHALGSNGRVCGCLSFSARTSGSSAESELWCGTASAAKRASSRKSARPARVFVTDASPAWRPFNDRTALLDGASQNAAYAMVIERPGRLMPSSVVLHDSPGVTGSASVSVPVDTISPA
jgi:hypothetical protein